ncbi:MAG: SIMPL domain-containing protein [Candidatus Eremiobacteraeota bacterium]|nr:SIMPL domain-containing protein [Candidatus Eremiobacteraeota bacterium]MBV9263407.1 SIMPL domain-containing protein [Candidatus Eremiobacteraeota bacterium]
MKRTFICLLGILIMVSAGTFAARAATTEIAASGLGSVSLPPNVATVNSSVETFAEGADAAVGENNARYERIVAALVKLGIARSDITLAYYNVSYNPRPQTGENPGERYGYTVSRSFSVKVRRIGDAGRVSDACMGSGATAIDGVAFGLADPTVARREAAAKAVAEARANASAVAEAAGLRVIGIKRLELLGGPQASPVPLMRAAAVAKEPTQFDQSNVNVTVSVNVIFLAGP